MYTSSRHTYKPKSYNVYTLDAFTRTDRSLRRHTDSEVCPYIVTFHTHCPRLEPHFCVRSQLIQLQMSTVSRHTYNTTPARTKMVERRRMNDLRSEIGIQTNLTVILLRSRMRWGGHVETLPARKLATTGET